MYVEYANMFVYMLNTFAHASFNLLNGNVAIGSEAGLVLLF